MTLIEAIILGFIQGATEFLPVSSSGHLVLLPAILGITPPGLVGSVIAHQGTLVAVLLYFWRDLLAIVRAVVSGLLAKTPLADSEARLGWFIVVGSIPAAIAGLLFEESLERLFIDPRWAAFFLLITAGLLVLGERLLSGTKTIGTMKWPDAITIGLFQMVALFPGISRSGSTIVAGLLRGLDRETAARYSFLLSIPVIGGAGLLGLLDLFAAPDVAGQLPALLTIFLSSAVVGLLCIHLLLRWLRRRNLYPFAIYCALLGGFYLLSAAL